MLVKKTQLVSMVTMMLLATMIAAASGCRPEPVEWEQIGTELEHRGYREIRIEAQTNQEVAELTVDDLIAVMTKIGFTDEQILEFGPDVHDALRRSGGVIIRVGKAVEAILRVKSRLLFIRSKSRGSFIYDLEKSRFGMM